MEHEPGSKRCVVLRSLHRQYTYLYLRMGLALDDLPEALRKAFGSAETVMELNLSADRKLAQEDARQVLANLAAQGWHLQLPPEDDPSGWLDLPRKG